MANFATFYQVWTKNLAHRIYAVIWHFLPKIIFLPCLAAILNFCVKCKIHLSWKQCQKTNFSDIFYPKVIRRVICHFLLKSVFPPFLAAILNFCIKQRNAFILETLQDRAILTKYLAPRVYAVPSGTLSRKHFPAIF